MSESKEWLKQVAKCLSEDFEEVSFIEYERIDQWVKEIQSVFIQKLSNKEVEEKLGFIYDELLSFMKKENEDKKETIQMKDAKYFIEQFPVVKTILDKDVEKTYLGDPSALSKKEIIATYPGVKATFIYRLAHILYYHDYKFLARTLSEFAHRQTGIDIHPGAKIGERFFIDHGTGLVIGETCKIGNNVTLYHGVTLGVLQFQRKENGELVRGTKRHPTIEDDVTIYAEAMVLGGNTVVGKGSVIGSNAMVTKSIPPNSKIIHKATI